MAIRPTTGWQFENNQENGSYVFVSHLPNFLRPDYNGNSERVINPAEIPFIRSDVIRGEPNNLQELINAIEPRYISYKVYANANGIVSEHHCNQNNYLMVSSFTANDPNPHQVRVASSTDYWKFAEPILPCTEGKDIIYGSENECWNLVSRGPDVITKVKSNNFHSGMDCKFEGFGGWEKARISFLIFVSVRMLDYCMQPQSNNIRGKLCYGLIDQYVTKTGGLDGQQTIYVKDYCARKFPNATDLTVLDNADEIDKQLCACNMPQSAYDKYRIAVNTAYPKMNIGSFSAPCLIDQCKLSSYKPKTLGGCPIPSCFNGILFNETTFEKIHSIDINQSSNCAGGVGVDADRSDNDNPTPSPDTDPAPRQSSNIIIIVIIAVLVLMILGAVIYAVANSE